MDCEIVVENFKSYKGEEVFPLGNFTAIAGPDSCGKADLIDAFCFVLGVKTSRIIEEDLKSLIHAETSRAIVKLTCRSLSFSRSITDGGECIWMVNEKEVIKEVYDQELRSNKIVDNRRKFIALRGDLESLVFSNIDNHWGMYFEQAIGPPGDGISYQQAKEKQNQAETDLLLARNHYELFSMLLEQQKWERKGVVHYNELKEKLKSEFQKYYHQLQDQHAIWQQSRDDADTGLAYARNKVATTITGLTKNTEEMLELSDKIFVLEKEYSLTNDVLLKKSKLTNTEKDKLVLENTCTKIEKEDQLKKLITELADIRKKDHSEDITRTSIDKNSFLNSEAIKDYEWNIEKLVGRISSLELQEMEMQSETKTCEINIDQYRIELEEAKQRKLGMNTTTSMETSRQLMNKIETMNDKLSDLQSVYNGHVEDALKREFHDSVNKMSVWVDTSLSVAKTSSITLDIEGLQRLRCLFGDEFSLIKIAASIDETREIMKNKMIPQELDVGKQIKDLIDDIKVQESSYQNLKVMRIEMSKISCEINEIDLKIRSAERKKKHMEDKIRRIGTELVEIREQLRNLKGQNSEHLTTSISSRNDPQIYMKIIDLIEKITNLKSGLSFLQYQDEYGLGKRSDKLKSSCKELKKLLDERRVSIQNNKKGIEENKQNADVLKSNLSALKQHEKELAEDVANKTKITDDLGMKILTLSRELEIEDFFLLSESTDILPNDCEGGQRLKKFQETQMSRINSYFRKTILDDIDTTQILPLQPLCDDLHRKYQEAEGLKEVADKEFESAKTIWLAHYTEAFEYLSHNINLVYQKLMGSITTSVYVSVCHDDIASRSGIKCMFTKQNHRWEMDQMSALEMTLGVLAFVLTIQSFKPSQFLIIDEVDGAFDDSAADRVGKFFGDYSRKKNCRIITISKKRKFYDKADTLIVVSHGFDNGHSKAHTLDLNKCKVS